VRYERCVGWIDCQGATHGARLLATWVDIGFLELRRITWDASAQLLEKLARYEAVHEVRSWLDLKDRLDADRRCYAYLHPAMPGEPLIFVEVALVGEMSDKIAPLLDPTAPRGDPREASAAVFYSISNCQRGLAGISLGNVLIKRVVDALSADFRRLRLFATLSPVPGFRRWLDTRLTEGEGLPSALAAALAKRTWHRDPTTEQALRKPLLRLGARYLLEEKAPDGGPRDPVARFHLGNGARLERLNWLADTSAKGIRESAGMMVNYVYRTDEIDANREAYAAGGRIVASRAIRDMLAGR
jgi:malonyl-CoA decarboxylase